jgi:hypothetical protein
MKRKLTIHNEYLVNEVMKILKGILQQFDKVNRNPSRPYHMVDYTTKNIIRIKKINKIFKLK